MQDENEAIAFMQRFSFATIVTSHNSLPRATHLPFVVTVKEDGVYLLSHFAKANDQYKDIEEGKVLVIFSEPHAYISTRHYDMEQNVPTWNYLAVHAYGDGKLITDTNGATAVLEQTIDYYESAYKQQWDHLPEDYKHKLIKGIIAFEIKVTELQGKKKLSQNRSESEKERIIDSFSKSEQRNEQLIAEYMKQEQAYKKG